jgi:hypothetical protein
MNCSDFKSRVETLAGVTIFPADLLKGKLIYLFLIVLAQNNSHRAVTSSKSSISQPLVNGSNSFCLVVVEACLETSPLASDSPLALERRGGVLCPIL